MSSPVILDLDASVGSLEGGLVIPLLDWQELVRFGCGMRAMQRLSETLNSRLPDRHGTVFLGSGDFHHLSYLLIERMAGRGPFEVVVFDNHPDNMRFPFGIHCGSWVRRVALLPFVSHVHVVGITSADVSWSHSWENYLRPLLSGKLTYWCIDVDTRWAALLGLSKSILSFASPAELMGAFIQHLDDTETATYLSIDKDVLSPDVVRTNWDQGQLTDKDLFLAIDRLSGRLVGSDITGEISAYEYKTAWKRWLSGLDGQSSVSGDALAEWQHRQHELNRRLMARLQAA